MKLVLQSIFTLIIILIGFWLFGLIPTPSSQLQGAGVLGIVAYPLAIAFYVSMVGILGVSIWNLITYIFREKDEQDYDASHSNNNKTYNYQPNFKQQAQDLNTAARHNIPTETSTENIQHKKNSLILSTFKIGSSILGVSFAIALALLVYFIYILKADSQKKELKTYHTLYKTEDYNDSRIIKYNQTLHAASEELIYADKTYEFFEADIKKEIALACIKVFLKEHNTLKSHQISTQIKHFKLNARNYYTKTDETIEQSIKQEKRLKKNREAYIYPYSGGYGLGYHSVGLEKSCKKEIPVNDIFRNFIPFYIKGMERKLEDYRIRAITSSNLKKILSSTKKWVETLHKRYPQ